VQILWHGVSDVGRVRELNEDHFFADPDLGLYLVCDGMGGHRAGDVASRLAAQTVHEHLRGCFSILTEVAQGQRSPDDAAACLRAAIELASACVHELGVQDTQKKGMGTTCSALLLLGGKGIMGHVGDSRLYLARQGQVYQLSEDHTFVQEAIRRGMLTPAQARESAHKNLVTRAVGPSPSVLVDTLVFDVLASDTLLLCSDGLHGYVDDPAELAEALARDEIDALCNRLIHTANERGGADNITCIVIRPTSDSAEDTIQCERTTRITAELSALHHIVLFSELDMKELVKVANACDHRAFGPGEVVVHEGEAAETLFVIVSGAATVSRGGADLALLRSGDHFGEMALLSRRPRSATVQTLQDSTLLALERDRFYGLLQADPVIGAKFLWRLAQTLSLRLDDVYVHQDRLSEAEAKKTTQRYGLFPSPFDGR
jgi:PPM family protein phosphatase